MNNETKELLGKVIEDRLKKALSSDAKPEDSSVAFEQAMKAVDRLNELEKTEASHDDQVEKRKTSTKEAKVNTIIRCVEVAGTILLVPIVTTVCNRAYAKDLCNFEKDYTFTTSAGKALSRLFRFGK